jgi:exodeoxyribonuclease VII large subunit
MHIFSVREITDRVKNLLETEFPFLWVRGQVSNLSRPSSGHLYFALKDNDALINVVWFRRSQRGADGGVDSLTGEILEQGVSAADLAEGLENGQEILVGGTLNVYPPRGQYQLLAELVQPVGLGELHLRFEALKKRFAARGWFDPDRKRSLPHNPARVALVTAPDSAACADFTTLAARRGLPATIRVYASPVQGDEAPLALARAIRAAGRQRFGQVVVLIRGGGSLEDLWAFNTEEVARAVYECPVPVLAGVGHEVDHTIADMIADVRAATPSHAAQLLWPERRQLVQETDELESRLLGAVNRRTERLDSMLAQQERGLGWLSPASRLMEREHRLAGLAARLQSTGTQAAHRSESRLFSLEERLRRSSGQERVERLEYITESLLDRLRRAGNSSLDKHAAAIDGLKARLTGADPTAPLGRGFCLVRSQEAARGEFIRSATEIAEGQGVEIVFRDAAVDATAERVRPGEGLPAFESSTPEDEA